MSLKPFQKIIVLGELENDLPRCFNQLQTSIQTSIDPLLKDPFNDAVILTDISLIIGTNQIDHKLGRAPQGYLVVSQDGPATFYSLQKTNSSPKLTLLLHSSAIVTVNLRIF